MQRPIIVHSSNKDNSAFWGQSFVSELTRISEHSEKKLRLKESPSATELNVKKDVQQGEAASKESS